MAQDEVGQLTGAVSLGHVKNLVYPYNNGESSTCLKQSMMIKIEL